MVERNDLEVTKVERTALRQLVDSALKGVSKDVRERSYAVMLGLITLPPGAKITGIEDIQRLLKNQPAFEAVLMDREPGIDQPAETDIEYVQCEDPIPTANGFTLEGENCLSYPFRGVILRLDGHTMVDYPFNKDSFELVNGVLLLADYNENKLVPADIHFRTKLTGENGEPITISATPDYSVEGKKRIAVALPADKDIALFYSLIGNSEISSQAFESIPLPEGESIGIKLPEEQQSPDGGVITDASTGDSGHYYGAVTPTPPASCSFSSLPYNPEEQHLPEGGAIIIGFALFLRYTEKKHK